MNGMWTSYNVIIGQKAYKDIRPVRVFVEREVEYQYTGHLWWKKTTLIKTGRGFLQFVYDKGPMTARYVDLIYFDTYDEAVRAFNQVSDLLFADAYRVSDKPSKSKKANKAKHLRLI